MFKYICIIGDLLCGISGCILSSFIDMTGEQSVGLFVLGGLSMLMGLFSELKVKW